MFSLFSRGKKAKCVVLLSTIPPLSGANTPIPQCPHLTQLQRCEHLCPQNVLGSMTCRTPASQNVSFGTTQDLAKFLRPDPPSVNQPDKFISHLTEVRNQKLVDECGSLYLSRGGFEPPQSPAQRSPHHTTTAKIGHKRFANFDDDICEILQVVQNMKKHRDCGLGNHFPGGTPERGGHAKLHPPRTLAPCSRLTQRKMTRSQLILAQIEEDAKNPEKVAELNRRLQRYKREQREKYAEKAEFSHRNSTRLEQIIVPRGSQGAYPAGCGIAAARHQNLENTNWRQGSRGQSTSARPARQVSRPLVRFSSAQPARVQTTVEMEGSHDKCYGLSAATPISPLEESCTSQSISSVLVDSMYLPEVVSSVAEGLASTQPEAAEDEADSASQYSSHTSDSDDDDVFIGRSPLHVVSSMLNLEAVVTATESGLATPTSSQLGSMPLTLGRMTSFLTPHAACDTVASSNSSITAQGQDQRAATAAAVAALVLAATAGILPASRDIGSPVELLPSEPVWNQALGVAAMEDHVGSVGLHEPLGWGLDGESANAHSTLQGEQAAQSQHRQRKQRTIASSNARQGSSSKPGTRRRARSAGVASAAVHRKREPLRDGSSRSHAQKRARSARQRRGYKLNITEEQIEQMPMWLVRLLCMRHWICWFGLAVMMG